jgi:large repetitive protein
MSVAVVGNYEVDEPATPLANLSTRGRVFTGDNVMIGGFVVRGDLPRQVAIVATGPSLTAHGIVDPLANPTLRLVRSSDQAVLATNDDWITASNSSELLLSGFAPTDTREAAILVTLQPGAYTAIVSGVGGGTGVSVVAVYQVN